VRNEGECVRSVCVFRCNIFIGVRIIKEIAGSVASGTPCVCVCMYIYICVCVYIYVCVYVCVFVRAFVWRIVLGACADACRFSYGILVRVLKRLSYGKFY